MVEVLIEFDGGSEGVAVVARPLRGVDGLPNMLGSVCMQAIGLLTGILGVNLICMQEAICGSKDRGDIIILAVKERLLDHGKGDKAVL
jgi:hypothetical protein